MSTKIKTSEGWKTVANNCGRGTDYSTNEVFTGKYWIDGKPIYRRVFTGLDYGNKTGSWTSTGVTIPNIERIIKGTALRDTMYCVRNEISFAVDTGGLINYFSGLSITTPHINIMILEYTKTTD